ncbi:hypothetical protein FK220_005205 [Flavobacteriaceae bacterium TP-CH-4]|uniref:Lipoprotein n=1 Tax=Pelagihabitans pacificus TaxID=2696054 RepID=A0A967E9R7_9FLAO|nr:hypothetical protein [Pelagihabitans pacificus]NHF58726.1 hypothetical protein [Pelagihabitans pacificus]
MKKRPLALLGLSFMLFLGGCSNSTSEVDNPLFPQELVISSFSVQAPSGWEWEQDQGIDTFIGRIFNNEDTIYFDMGYLSFGGLELVEKSARNISFQPTAINGVPAIIEKEYTPEGESNGEIRLSVYLDAGDRQRLNRLYIFDPKDEQTVLAIFRSHKFE